MARAKYCVFVGRFQPFHNGHFRILVKAFEEAEQVLLVIGSNRTPSSPKNPWSYEERAKMIMEAVPADLHPRLKVLPLRDFMYNDLAWVTSLQNIVSQIVGHGNELHRSKLIGCFKDDSSYYLQLFPQWELVREPYYWNLDAKDIRQLLFDCDPNNVVSRQDSFSKISKMVPTPVVDHLNKYVETDAYANLRKEHQFIQNYKEQWKTAPFPPVFVTTDAVLVKSGHVLLIRRGMNPGKGKLALPGGFIKPDESIYKSAIRELKEETKIVVPTEVLNGSLAGQHVFDHPSRDTRGRTITHAYYFKLDGGGPLPQVEGDDDAKEAVWLPLGELAILEEQFYSDHLHIINYFVSSV